jgi:hypothetical protein
MNYDVTQQQQTGLLTYHPDAGLLHEGTKKRKEYGSFQDLLA